VPDQGSDEISQMGRSVNAMLDKINDLFRGLNDNMLDMERLAYYDQLTGLQNRAQFKKQLSAALHACDRDKHHLALLYLDLDHFKRINDTLGHETGDRLLAEIASRLTLCLREDDSVARLGGDEFAVLLQRVDSARVAYVVANKIIAALNTPMQLMGQEVVVGVSIGITMAPDDSRDVDSLMTNADLAMYQAKDKGRNSMQFYTPDMNLEVENRLNLERELRNALKCHEFALYYQPQVDVHSGQIVGAEALIRWHHPKKGKVVERLERLRAMGVNLAIDDFGTGYSSLSHLKRLPVKRLKVDRSFVEGLPDDEEDRAITSLIVAMANSLGYEVVVEGVETQAQLVFLARCGCDYIQGYYFSRPVPADELLVLLFGWQPEFVQAQMVT
jgi:diguanylate cyclase (GGDEF)-like protein